ncbi:MAG: hypothetical protein U5M23_07175 [Marinagarivorans sp.]|nr:hypothetical protein [Marinagarivorans sp.]
MLTATQLNRLIEPLIARSSRYCASKFSDRAADLVLERLGVNTSGYATSINSIINANDLTWWVDQKARRFFEAHPLGQGIEVNCGISTRFHRMSERSDWPQFSWQSVNFPEVDDCLKFAIPEVDNFRSVASAKPEEFWLKHLNGIGATAVFAVIGEADRLTFSQLKDLIDKLATINLTNLKHLELVIVHNLNSLQPMLDGVKLQPLVFDEWSAKPYSKFRFFLQRLFFKKRYRLNASYLKLH